MARTISPKHELQREEILDRAAAAFAAHSYPGTSMNDLAQACGTSKARLYHYYPSKDAILFDLLDRYTRHLIAIATEQAAATPARRLHQMICAFLAEYEHSRTRHIVLLNDVKFLDAARRAPILDAQRRLVAFFADAVKAAYPDRIGPKNKAALTMLLFGMINWTFTWLKPGNGIDGKLSYAGFATMVETMFTRGIEGMPACK
jgi:AcrR family transcriptional regulator